MLPMQYTTVSDSTRSRSSSVSTGSSIRPSRPDTKLCSGSSFPMQQPPLGITGVICQSRTLDIPGRGALRYTIYRPRMLEVLTQRRDGGATITGLPPSVKITPPPPPLICVAGGPGMPCQYLSSLVHMVTDRAVILYDHVGCGQSTPMLPAETNASSVDSGTVKVKTPLQADDGYLNGTVHDLALLIESVFPASCSFHLLGHSLGGIIAYEYLKRHGGRSALDDAESFISPRCRSLILASTPLSIAASHMSSQTLLNEIRLELKQNDDNENDDDDEGFSANGSTQSLSSAVRCEFQLRHECRVSPMPLCLQQSLEGLLPHRLVARQLLELQNYVAEPFATVSTVGEQPHGFTPPPSLILRGQYDFIDEANMDGWIAFLRPTSLLGCATGTDSSIASATDATGASTADASASQCQFITLANCSHYSLVENEDLFGSVVLAFLRDHDADHDVTTK